MTIQLQVLVWRCCSNCFSLCPSPFDFSLQGLAHLKAEQGTLFLLSLCVYIGIVFPPTAWLGFGAFTLCAPTTCPCSFVCCGALSLLLQRTGLGLFVCSCVCVCVCFARVRCMAAVHFTHLTFASLSPPPFPPRHDSVSPNHCFTQASVDYIIVYCFQCRSRKCAVTHCTVPAWPPQRWG